MTRRLDQAFFLSVLLAALGAPAEARVDVVPEQIAVGDQPVGDSITDDLPDVERVPDTIGPYRLIKEIGSGGMGTVYLAQSEELEGRRVALKVIRGGLASPDLLAQFEVERQALAAADHDHVARLFDSGTTAEGHPWLAMEYVQGEPITKYCDGRRLTVEDRLRLFVRVCAAVQHLHDQGVLHGDLKPDNILVIERDGCCIPKIIDLGLARYRARDRAEPSAIAGTPAYMSPEHFTLAASELDQRSDVFSLGIILHELLIGIQPASAALNAKPLNAKPLHAKLGMAAPAWRGESLPPSARLRELGTAAAAIAEERGTHVASLRLRLSGALDRTVHKAVERRRARRHASAAELASDLERDMRAHAHWVRVATAGAWLCSAALAGWAGGMLAFHILRA